ncbi:MAG: hypothetical protein HN348_22400 [Proteobacteria bacterium]|jgi:hypothetical protein|nr:hypothetical protein [Pseudomonadota bacterium]
MHRNLVVWQTAALLVLGLGLSQPATAGKLTNAVEGYLKNDTWNPQPLDDLNGWEMAYQGTDDSWTCVALVFEDRQQFLFYSVLDVTVESSRRDEMAHFLNRANHQMVMGNFELNMDMGELRFKTSIDVEGGDLGGTMLHNLLYTNVLTMDRYISGINAVHQGADPLLAIEGVEG